MSRWECLSGHVLEGNFFYPPAGSNLADTNPLATFSCPSCDKVMTLSGREGAMDLLKRIRGLIGEVSRDPHYETSGALMLTEVERLEFTIRKLAEEAARP